VHLLRHGEVENPTGVLYGRMPGFVLSELGKRQALVVAEHLAGNDITHVVASPLERAQQTAAPITDSHQLTLDTDDRLIEADNVFQGLRVAVGDGALRSPRYWHRLRNPFLPSWGEPYMQIARRMLAAAYRARARAEGHEAVCVSHQLPIWTLRRFLEGKRLWHDPRRRQCSLASLTSLLFADERLVGIRYTEPAGASSPKATGA
jgi:broad specificity phosphatase PhoE